MRARTATHGSEGYYVNHRCRCDQCRAANRLAMQRRRARRFDQGLCVEAGCSQSHIPNRQRCQRHLDAQRARAQRRWVEIAGAPAVVERSALAGSGS